MLSYKKPGFIARNCDVEVLGHHFGIVESSLEIAECALSHAKECLHNEDEEALNEQLEKFATAVATMYQNPSLAETASNLEEQMFDLLGQEYEARTLMSQIEDRHEDEVDLWIAEAEAAQAKLIEQGVVVESL